MCSRCILVYTKRMRRTLNLSWKPWALGLVAYALVSTREAPVVYAQVVVDTDCTTELDQPDTTYRLTGDVSGNCVIAADNIILDGQSLYTISGDVTATAEATVDFMVRNVTVEGNVDVNNFGADTGNITIVNSDIDGHVMNASQYGSTGDINISDSSVEDRVLNTISSGGDAGDITITNSYIGSYIIAWDYEREPNVTIINSTVDGNGGRSFNGSHFSIGNNAPLLLQYKRPNCTIVNSSVTNPAITNCETLTVIDDAPDLSVTPLNVSIWSGDTFNPFSGVKAQDAKDGDLSGDVMVVGQVGEENGIYELTYSVTDSGTTLYNIFDNATTTIDPHMLTVTRTVARSDKQAQSTNVATHKANKEKQVKEAAQNALPNDVTATIETLTTALAQPVATNDPEALKKLIDLVRQLIVALLELLAAQGKLK